MVQASDVPMEVSEQELQGLYTWVDEIPLSRPKRNIARDFSDGVLAAEVVHHYFPKLVELHNYSSANATAQKLYNWSTLNQKVFKRLGFTVPKAEVEAISNCQPGSIERVLKLLKIRIAKSREEGFTGAPAAPTVPAIAMAAPAPGGGFARGGSFGAGAGMGPEGLSAVPRMGAPVLGAIHPGMGKVMGGIPAEVVAEKDEALRELRETNEILETKVRKLEQLVRLKDAKIATLMAKLQAAGMA